MASDFPSGRTGLAGGRRRRSRAGRRRSRAGPRLRLAAIASRPSRRERRHGIPKASKATASQSVEDDGYEGHFEHLAGGLTVGFETYHKDEDLSDAFAGLPGNRCPCPHWGYVQQGRVVFQYADRTESYGAGDAYYAPPGHTPVLFAGTQIVEFSPTEELKRTMEVMAKNQQAGEG